jgi:hypothetical protein
MGVVGTSVVRVDKSSETVVRSPKSGAGNRDWSRIGKSQFAPQPGLADG